MRRGLRHATAIALLSITALICAAGAQAATDTAGTVHFVGSADSSFDAFTSNASPQSQSWMRAHMWRMITWSPYFDDKTGWYPQGWVYDDAYAIYSGSSLAAQHPEWILKDSAGNRLFIPYGCSGASCPQYAGDISNPAFRHYWIEQARARLAHGYRGLFVDDVNMEERVGNSSEAQIEPVNAAGSAIDAAAWRAYMAEFMAEVRAAFPSAEIVHNALWFANGHAGLADPSIRRQIEAANYVLLERGVNDSGLSGGNGAWSLNALFAYVDAVHSLGRGVVLDGSAGDPQGIEYNLASYFLISGGNDAVGAKRQSPSSWWPGLDVNLGEATGARHVWSNVLRRDFSGGMALVNPPGSPTQTITLPGTMRDARGNTVTSLTLTAASGAVLLGSVGPSSAASQAPAAAATQTTLEARVIRTHRLGGRHHHKRSRAHAGSAHRRRWRAPGGSLLTRVAGIVRQATRGSVLIGIDVRRGHRWIATGRLSLSVTAAGRFSGLLALRPTRRYRVCATYTGAVGYRPSWSGYRLITPRARWTAGAGL